MVDVARHLAATQGHSAGLAPTMQATTTHGPATRVDWVCASRPLLPAAAACEVVDADGDSDHDYVVVSWHLDTLIDILRRPVPQPTPELSRTG